MKLAREMQADYEIDDFDVAQVERTAEDRRGFEAVDLVGGWDQALVFGSDGQPGEQVAVLAARRGEVRLERAGAVPGPGEAALEGIQAVWAWFNAWCRLMWRLLVRGAVTVILNRSATSVTGMPSRNSRTARYLCSITFNSRSIAARIK